MIALILASLLLAPPPLEGTPKVLYVPLTCVAHLTVVDWGACTHVGDKMDCPNVHVTFLSECSAPKASSGKQIMAIEHPTVIQLH